MHISKEREAQVKTNDAILLLEKKCSVSTKDESLHVRN
jgi:hypothetical protein